MDLKDLKSIIDLMRKNSVSELELEKEGFKIRLKRGSEDGQGVVQHEYRPVMGQPMMYSQAHISTGGAQMISPAEPVRIAEEGAEIKSPMIGTFYKSPSPDAAPFVEIGKQVEPETVVCIIEAMKVMNEIKAEVRGVITEVVADNFKPVEYGQVLFRIKPN
ncbi:MAG: acetyl-CoA carboxylase biotin carboxyl carrier protein [Pedosphaera sp.]|nr:acetyl-CoA carboxylase biotin carboxyl carrier protein [Pedosphaera sp.]